MKPRPTGVGRGERSLCRPRTALLAALAAALLVAVVLLKGSEAAQDSELPAAAPSAPKTARDERERPVDARPSDPRRKSAEQRPAPVRPPPGPDTRPRSMIAVRVLDSAGKPRTGIPVELVSAAAGAAPGQPLDAIRFSDAAGGLGFSWPKSGTDRELLISAGMILEEPLVVPVPRSGLDPVTLRIPESGDVLAAVTDTEGRPFEQPVNVLVLVAANDPWPAPAGLERASRQAVAGRARIPFVEAGTLLLVEGRSSDRSFTIAPKLVEGPASEGAVVEISLIARKRETIESAPALVPKFLPAQLGPTASTTQIDRRDGTVRIAVRPRDALPQWPLVLEVGLWSGPRAALDRAARVDPRATVTLGMAPGRYEAACRLWRIMPDGWLTSDVEILLPGQPAITVTAGRQHSVEIAVDPKALSAAAAALMAW